MKKPVVAWFCRGVVGFAGLQSSQQLGFQDSQQSFGYAPASATMGRCNTTHASLSPRPTPSHPASLLPAPPPFPVHGPRRSALLHPTPNSSHLIWPHRLSRRAAGESAAPAGVPGQRVLSAVDPTFPVSMDEKTEELRDIFQSVSDSDTVTERQEEGRGSLGGSANVREGLREIIEGMSGEFEFENSLSTDELVTVVERYYDGDSDEAIAAELGDASRQDEVATARLDLHLVRDADLEPEFSMDRLGELLEAEEPVESIAETLDTSPDTVRFHTQVLEIQHERRRVADRYREAFEDVLQDRDLSERLTSSLKETGLEGATEGQEVDVDM